MPFSLAVLPHQPTTKKKKYFLGDCSPTKPHDQLMAIQFVPQLVSRAPVCTKFEASSLSYHITGAKMCASCAKSKIQAFISGSLEQHSEAMMSSGY
jgi:hypothetical protein